MHEKSKRYSSMKETKYHKIIMGLLVIVAPLLYKLVGQGCFVLLYSSLIGVAWQSYKQRCFTLSKIDIFVSIYLLYGLYNMLFVKENGTDSLFILQWLFLISVYILSRGIGDKKIIILYILILTGFVQSIIGILQFNGVMESGHSDFAVTGSFPNPGPYGGYLALSLLSAIAISVQTKQKLEKIGNICLSTLFIVMLLISGSRAGILATICGVLYLVFGNIKLKHRTISQIGIALLLITSCIGLYFVRIGSADARLLLWRVCLNIFADHPVMGNGVASLPSVYMDYQASYFANTPNPMFIDIANNNIQAFNEFIHIACEQGIVGLCLFLAILFLVFKSKGDRNIKALFISLLVFSSFSYPADVLSLKMMFTLFIGLAVCNVSYKVKLMRWMAVTALLLIPVVVCVNLHYQKAFNDITLSKTAMLPNNQDYMLQYAKMNNDIETLTYLTNNICSSSEILCDMGDAYANVGDTTSADSCYSRAFEMVPNRILPLYNLFLMYQDSISAQRVINFKPKIINSLTLRAKAQSKEFLKPKTYE